MLAVVFVLALVVAIRRGRHDVVRLAGVTIGFTLVAWVSVARIVDEPFDYLVRWTELAGLFVWLTIGWTVLEEVRGLESVRARRLVGAAGAVVVVATLAVGVVTSVRAFEPPPAIAEQRVYDRLAPRLRRLGPTLPRARARRRPRRAWPRRGWAAPC